MHANQMWGSIENIANVTSSAGHPLSLAEAHINTKHILSAKTKILNCGRKHGIADVGA